MQARFEDRHKVMTRKGSGYDRR